jgi:hypothetical protein
MLFTTKVYVGGEEIEYEESNYFYRAYFYFFYYDEYSGVCKEACKIRLPQFLWRQCSHGQHSASMQAF